MDDYNLTAANDIQLTLEMCEAVDCFSHATAQIEVRVGQLGTISLSLCKDCVSKFRDDGQ
jgi:hypothetical protein